MALKMTVFLIIVLSLPLLAQKETQLLKLNDVLEIANKNNPALKNAKLDLKKSKEMQWSGLGLDNPKLMFMQEGIESSSYNGFAERQIGIQQNIDFPLKSYFRTASLIRAKKASKALVDYQQNKLRANVKIAYTKVLYAKRLQKLQQKELEIADRLHRISDSRFKSGDASELEFMRTEIRLSESKNALEEAANIYHATRYNLFETIGLDAEEQRYSLEFYDTLLFKDPNFDEEDLFVNSMKQPILIAVEHQIQSAKNKKYEVGSSFFPDISLNLYKQDFGNGYDFVGFEAGFSIPLWFFSNQAVDLSSAKVRYAKAVNEKHKINLQIKKEIELAWHNYKKNQVILTRYDSKILDRVNQLMQATVKGYELGEIDLLNLLDTQRTFINSRKNYFKVLRDYYISLIELEQFTDNELVYN
ncbi:MAG: TolC family protein [Calditrichaeota bacterium]|nr:MAG: TolC family protein [Calditrichota bacterium]MBL1207351.1 TolC family protein [Calditrichota bacterium]NOG47183.1 TolC family protein [Calditrichota bacterium]